MLYQHLSAGRRTLLGAITGDAKPSHGGRDGLAVSSIRGPPRQAAISCSLSSKPQTGKEPVSTALHATFNLSSLFCCMNNEINEGFLHIMQTDTLQSKKDWTQYSPFCSLEIIDVLLWYPAIFMKRIMIFKTSASPTNLGQTRQQNLELLEEKCLQKETDTTVSHGSPFLHVRTKGFKCIKTYFMPWELETENTNSDYSCRRHNVTKMFLLPGCFDLDRTVVSDG